MPKKSNSPTLYFQSSVKKILLVYRPDRQQALDKANEVIQWLLKRDIKAVTHPDEHKLEKCRPLKSLKGVDMALVLGGDGTYLEAVRLLKGHPLPILGINMGSLGFLTQIRLEDLCSSLEKTLDGKMQMRPRSMLRVSLKKKSKAVQEWTALNDVVMERGERSHLIHLSIFCDKQLVSSLKADGLIISSPTGSTAYNLASGGPIMHPESSAVCVTPISPHSLTSRPLVFPDHLRLDFEIQNKFHLAKITVDGQHRAELGFGDILKIQRSPHDHFVLRAPGHNYFGLLREKLKFGERD